jgi:hypothetical protein
MKTGDTYRFSLSWPMETQEQMLAGEFLNKLKNKKSRFLVHLICEYLKANPEAMTSKETLKLIVESTPTGDALADLIRNIVQSELVGKVSSSQQQIISDAEQPPTDDDAGIADMLGNLDIFI